MKKFFLGCILLVSCSAEPNLDRQTEATAPIQFTISVPAPALPTATRAIGTFDESRVQTVDVLVFDTSNLLTEHKIGHIIRQSDQDISKLDSYTLTFSAELTYTTAASQVVVIANAAQAVADGLNTLGANPSKVEVLGALIIQKPGVWGTDAIPMYAEKAVTTIARDTRIDGVQFVRMLGRIDVNNAVPGQLSIKRVYLANVADRGYIAPKWDPTTGAILTNSGVQGTNVPANAVIQTDPTLQEFVWPASGGLVGQIYAFETAQVVDTSLGSHYLIVEGEMAGTGETYFWRVNLCLTGGQPFYFALQRNTRYNVTITAVEAVGYRTLAEAMAARGELSNMRVYTQSVTYDGFTNLSFNGQYWLGSAQGSETWPVEFGPVAATASVPVSTNYPGYNGAVWNIDDSIYPNGIEYVNGAGWLSAAAVDTDKTTGSITVTTLSDHVAMSGAPRVARVHLLAGTLHHTIAVRQAFDYSGVKAVYGTIGYIWDPGGPDHRKLTILGDKDYYNGQPGEFQSQQNQYRVYLALFKFGSLVAATSQVGVAKFNANEVVMWPEEWAEDRAAMEAKFAGAAEGADAMERIPNFTGVYPTPGNNTQFPGDYPVRADLALDDPCVYYDQKFFGGQGWRTPTLTEVQTWLIGGNASDFNTLGYYSWYLNEPVSVEDPGRGIFPQAVGGTCALPTNASWFNGRWVTSISTASYRTKSISTKDQNYILYFSGNGVSTTGYVNIFTGTQSMEPIRCIKP